MEYTKRRNLNRGYMKLEVWQRAMDLFEMTFRLAGGVSDFKLRSQFTDAAQWVSANIAEGIKKGTQIVFSVPACQYYLRPHFAFRFEVTVSTFYFLSHLLLRSEISR